MAQNVQKMSADEKAQAAAAAAAQQSNPPNDPNAQQPTAPQANAPQPSQNGQQGNPHQAPAAAQPPQGQTQAPQANPALTQAAQQQTPIGQTAGQAADDVQRAARHETRLENKVAGEQLDQLGKQIETAAKQQVPAAQQALQQAQQAAQAQPAVSAADTGLQKSLEKLAAMAQSRAGASRWATAGAGEPAGFGRPTTNCSVSAEQGVTSSSATSRWPASQCAARERPTAAKCGGGGGAGKKGAKWTKCASQPG